MGEQEIVQPDRVLRELRQLNFALVVIGALLAAEMVIAWAALGQLGRMAAANAEHDRAPAAPQGSAMAWDADGAGDDTYNGRYLEAGTHNGLPFFVFTGPGWTRFLYDDGGAYVLGSALDDAEFPYIGTASAALPANDWTATGFGTEPAPTLSAYTGGDDHERRTEAR